MLDVRSSQQSIRRMSIPVCKGEACARGAPLPYRRMGMGHGPDEETEGEIV